MGDVFTEGGMDELDWCKAYFDATDLPKITTWEEFEEKGYVVVPFPDDYKSTPAMRWFAEDRKRDTPDWGPRPGDTVGFKGLQTPSGKIEFVSKTLKNLERDVVDPERPAMGPQFIPSWEGHHTTELYGTYPLQMVSPHPRFSFHTMGDCKGTWLNEVDEHRILHDDGHRYWIMRLNSKDAAARGIAEGDLIRAFNDRGAVILTRAAHRARGAGHGPLLRELRRVPAAGRAGRVDRRRRLRQHPHQQADDHPDVPGNVQQLLPHPG